MNLPACGRPWFSFWVGKVPWRREQAPTPVFLPGDPWWAAVSGITQSRTRLKRLSSSSSSNVGDLGLIPGLGRSPGEGNSYSLQYSDLENSMDYIVHGVTKSQAWLNNIHFLFWNKYVCLVCGKLTSNGIKLNLWKFQVHIDTRKLIIFHMTFQYCLLKLRNAVGINLSC